VRGGEGGVGVGDGWVGEEGGRRGWSWGGGKSRNGEAGWGGGGGRGVVFRGGSLLSIVPTVEVIA